MAERYFYADIGGRDEEFDASAFGEELVFEVMGRFFGGRPDRVHPRVPTPSSCRWRRSSGRAAGMVVAVHEGRTID